MYGWLNKIIYVKCLAYCRHSESDKYCNDTDVKRILIG